MSICSTIGFKNLGHAFDPFEPLLCPSLLVLVDWASQDLILHRLDTFLEGSHSKVVANVIDEIFLAVSTVVF